MFSTSGLVALRAAIVRSVWSSKMLQANTPVIQNLLDGRVGVDPIFSHCLDRFRFMRRYLPHWHDEVSRIFLMLDLIAQGAAGHGPVHLLLTSAAEIGFAWDGSETGWIRAALPILRECFRGLSNIFRALF